MKRRVVIVMAGVALLVAVAGTAAAIGARRARASADPSLHPFATATATVVRTDLTATTSANATLGFAPIPPVVNRLDGTYTWLPTPGQIVPAGGTLFAVDDQPVLEMPGAIPAYRAFQPGMTDGPDVAQLQAGLVALGDDPGHQLGVDRHFGWATTAAIEHLQRAHGMSPTGDLELGRVVFTVGPVRVGPLQADIGQPATVATPYQTTSTRPVVTFGLDADRQGQVPIGTRVGIDLLDGHRTTGRIVVVVPDASGPGPSSGSGSTGQAASGTTATVTVTVALDASTGALPVEPGAPVTVAVAVSSRHQVLAVPVTALLALAEGGYGVEVVEAHRRQLIGVSTGLFAQSLVEVSGPDLAAGQRVVVSQ